MNVFVMKTNIFHKMMYDLKLEVIQNSTFNRKSTFSLCLVSSKYDLNGHFCVIKRGFLIFFLDFLTKLQP